MFRELYNLTILNAVACLGTLELYDMICATITWKDTDSLIIARGAIPVTSTWL